MDSNDKITFSKLKSGNREIDDFLQSTDGVLQWFPYTQFENIKEIGKGGFATIYYAEWKNEMYEPEIVLKEFHNSQEISTKFLNEISALHKCMKKDDTFNFLGCYGMSQNTKTKNYIIVMQYFEKGSLNRNLGDVVGKRWQEKLKMLSQIAMDLKTIHEVGLIHKDFHSGNILQDNLFDSYISDMGLSEPPNAKNNGDGIYGVLPYVAPEVLCGGSYSTASDIYSFGIIMWEFTSGKPPFANNAHDFDLQFGIVTGLRPTIISGIPQCYIDLMKDCWNEIPNKRPTAEYIYNTLEEWINDHDIQRQFVKSDEMTNSNNMFSSLEIHPNAIYTSRFIHNSYNYLMRSKSMFRTFATGMSRFVSAYLKNPTEKIVAAKRLTTVQVLTRIFIMLEWYIVLHNFFKLNFQIVLVRKNKLLVHKVNRFLNFKYILNINLSFYKIFYVFTMFLESFYLIIY
ncbi:kinase-like domain-containing protein [Gigaspora rosea]|uniref:Kinase-like domain-containing protein n=1 Tax=Gigaspora rosea TaxID=44941 RepID=A0A397VHE4_9GLOM|nr:kinase-like domain-containing protein [Gigaspora rosea]